jgi:hypothetical protein
MLPGYFGMGPVFKRALKLWTDNPIDDVFPVDQLLLAACRLLGTTRF